MTPIMQNHPFSITCFIRSVNASLMAFVSINERKFQTFPLFFFFLQRLITDILSTPKLSDGLKIHKQNSDAINAEDVWKYSFLVLKIKEIWDSGKSYLSLSESPHVASQSLPPCSGPDTSKKSPSSAQTTSGHGNRHQKDCV